MLVTTLSTNDKQIPIFVRDIDHPFEIAIFTINDEEISVKYPQVSQQKKRSPTTVAKLRA